MSVNSCAFRFFLVCAALCVSTPCETVRLHSEEGWDVPALKQTAKQTPERQGTLEIAGTAVQYKTFSFSPVAPAYRVMFLSPKDGAYYVTWQNVEPKSISVYNIRDRMFAVIVEGVIRMDLDPKTGEGGTAGEVRLAYQDVDGSGKLKLALQNLPFDFRPEVASWVKK